jgi:hypothetical protein
MWIAQRRSRHGVLFLAAVLAALWLPLAGCSSSGDSGGSPGTQNEKVTSVLIAADDNGDIYLIDTTSGATLLALDVWSDDGQGNRIDLGPIGGMVYDPARNRVLAVLRIGGGVCDGCSYTIDPASGEATLLNDVDLADEDVGDLAWDSAAGAAAFALPWDGTIYGYIDPVTGDVFQDGVDPGSSCCNGFGLTFAADRTLYVTADDKLYSLDPATDFFETLIGTFTYLGFPTAPSGSEYINSLTMAGDGTIYGIMEDGAATYLVSVDPVQDAPVVTWLATLAGHMDALAMVPLPATAVLLAADVNGDIYRINPANGAITVVRDVWEHDENGDPVDIGRVGGMVFDPRSGRMLAGIDWQAATCGGCVYTIDMARGQAVLLNGADLYDVADLARRPSDGSVIVTSYSDGTDFNWIDPITGAVTLINQYSNNGCCDGRGIVFGADGTPYVAGVLGEGIDWYTLDPANLALEVTADSVTYQGFPAVLSADEWLNSLAMWPDGSIYGIMEDGAAVYLVTVDPVPGAPVVTWRATLPKLLDGLTVLPLSLASVKLPTQTGTIGGLTFTVVEGAISQSGPNQPLTSVGGPATLLFDAPVSTLVTTPEQVGLHATGTLNDGGSFTALAFGAVSGVFANGLASRIQRNGTAIDYAFLYLMGGIPVTDDTGTLTGSLTGTVHLSTDLQNNAGNPLLNLYPPDGGSFCSGASHDTGNTPDNGTTDRIGIRILDGTLDFVEIGDLLNNC